MKRGSLFLVLVCFLLIWSLIVKADLEQNIDSNIKKIEDTTNKITDIQETKWDYLAKEWKDMFLKNPVISEIDSFLTKISIVFETLLGVKYSFSIAFFFMILVWFYLLFDLSYLLKVFFSNGIGWIMSFLVLLIFARVGFFPLVVLWTGKMFMLLGEFIKILPILIFIFVVVVCFLFYYFENTMRLFVVWYLKKMRRLRDEQRKMDETLLHSMVQGLRSGLTGKR